ncbi:5340_t:CDS:2 [Racocetra fulgida]|uniref:5340_t:CDS:1 n=1 Tax=Racocetra fulgida TaxID=60492 RepID=A0A9N9I059_9GLOM|nr:5340_t:CDS:2 [Racocetra fulgida]
MDEEITNCNSGLVSDTNFESNPITSSQSLPITKNYDPLMKDFISKHNKWSPYPYIIS